MLKRQLFGKRSERYVDNRDESQLLLPGFEPPPKPEFEEKVTKEHVRKTRKDKNPGKISFPDALPL